MTPALIESFARHLCALNAVASMIGRDRLTVDERDGLNHGYGPSCRPKSKEGITPVKLLVTGGGGFIGSHLVDRLVRDGHEVRVVDNFTTGHRRNLDSSCDEIELVE